jgi:ubiquinone/menaquinone biosynthesis C-methylase UbiE
MASRDAQTTRRKLQRLAAQLPLAPSSRVLDIGPGDGQLFDLVAADVRWCLGIDPNAKVIDRLRLRMAGRDDVAFATGTANGLPVADSQFDVVVINSVLQLLPDTLAIEACVRELARVCRPGGTIFVGELPFQDELEHGIAAHLVRKLRESGLANLSRLLFHQYLLPLARREPLILYPTDGTFVPAEEFQMIVRSQGLTVETTRHRELKAESLTRNDYVIQKPRG